jgi:MoaA/NifB/PqqE/SkfB family radical SAM enzyme
MQVFYVNIGGGEPTVRPDFWELVDYATAHHVGVKFSTNGVRITPEIAARLAASDYVDVQISIDGATADVNDAVRGDGSFAMAVRALENLAAAGYSNPATTSNSSMSSRRWPTATAPPCGSPGCDRPAGAQTSGTTCTPPPRSR